MTAVNPAVDPEMGNVPPPEYDPTNGLEAPQYTNEPPPSYNSVVAQIRKAKETSTDNKGFAAKIFACLLCGSVAVAIMIILGIALPVADIVIGSLYIYDCPAQRMIPVYLVVSGCFILLRTFITIGDAIHKKKSDEDDDEYTRPMLSKCLEGPLTSFLIVWFILGSVWVFSLKDHQSALPHLANYCHDTVYLYAFWMLISGYIASGVMLLCCIIVCCCACITA